MMRAVLQHWLTPKMHAVLQHTNGWAANIFPEGVRKSLGIVSIPPDLRSATEPVDGIRAERFHDRNGWRVFSPYRILSA